ncbi:metal ABC transporter permease [Leptospira meyeri]|uniref:metal ABC transporter permease n=1 Tax=Leptospira meyeri TaxID=29508 RepID=UPI000C2AA5A4|nr:metal ABC transporter permease [Leptospira meyeri]PKA22116.1 ABC transporter permease [Leptospira sp. mixed culture ATI2-C-A1]PJZ82902.1 ABC transporter permease [Leptospira meyeri]PJZ97860.1 ABC transporter permease [Leptospira meyeri]PKA11313.1 ABC transporter permease [Leptospira meyeri]TGL16759.1 metal ABC transporter permease [Leptospira meyeri]
MTNILSSWTLFLPQILVGSLVGALLSVLGILIVLRGMTFFGVTLSQAVTFSVALSLFMEWPGEIFPILFSSVLVFPLLYVRKLRGMKEEVILGILFVFFSAASQVMLALGGNVQNHLMAAFFGDILTSQVRTNSFGIYIAIFFFILYLSFFRRFLFISFDRDEYKIQVGNPLPFDLLFYIILAASLTVAVNLLGTFYSIAHLILPVFALLPIIRSLKLLTVVCVLFSVFSTISGFLISLVGIERNGEMIYFPTSSSIILVLCGLAFFLHLIRFLTTSVFSKSVR